MSSYKLSERAVLMRLSVGLPGKNRKDRNLSANVKQEHGLGQKSGSWVKNKFPDWALAPIEKVVNEARAYHAAVTLPFDAGIGILPGALIMEYGDKIRQFKGQFDNLCASHFRAKYPEMIEWAKVEHNGTFDADDYPEVEEVMQAFGFRSEPLPVPDAGHFEKTMLSLLGADADSVNIRVTDAMQEAQRELMRRIIEPVRAMAAKLSETPKGERKDIIFRDTLVDNLKAIVGLAPKLNLSGDVQIDAFVQDIGAWVNGLTADRLREEKALRGQVKQSAAATLAKLEAYKF